MNNDINDSIDMITVPTNGNYTPMFQQSDFSTTISYTATDDCFIVLVWTNQGNTGNMNLRIKIYIDSIIVYRDGRVIYNVDYYYGSSFSCGLHKGQVLSAEKDSSKVYWTTDSKIFKK